MAGDRASDAVEASAKCIYCLEQKLLSEFNREHVLHRAFGGFEEALTLVAPYDPGVYRACNDYFSSTVDLAITRDSIEALLRVEHGLKAVTDMKGMLTRRIEIRLPADHRFGPLWLTLLPGPTGDESTVAPMPQVRFGKRGGGSFICLKEAQLRAEDPRENVDIDTTKKSLFWNASDEAAKDRLIAILDSYGIGFNPGEKFVAPEGLDEIDTEIQWIVDRLIGRAIAKIAFNYLAKNSAAAGREFVFSAMFDAVRRFIRYDEGPKARQFVDVFNAPSSMAPEGRTGADHHVLAVRWEEEPKGHILGYVKLFGYAEYVIRLAKEPRGIWLDLATAHAYSLKTRRVSRLARGRTIRPARG